jgi:hypothetical protein
MISSKGSSRQIPVFLGGSPESSGASRYTVPSRSAPDGKAPACTLQAGAVLLCGHRIPPGGDPVYPRQPPRSLGETLPPVSIIKPMVLTAIVAGAIKLTAANAVFPT